MLELYLFATLVAVGYILTSRESRAMIVPGSNAPDDRSLRPMTVDMARREEFRRGEAAYRRVVEARAPGYDELREKNAYVVQSLSGRDIPASAFAHRNMQPFYRGALKSNTNDASARVTLENFTGVGELAKAKTETRPLFAPVRADPIDPEEVESLFRTRTGPGQFRNNVLPFEQIRVGPGVGLGAAEGPRGGFQQLETNELVRPRDVDELRGKSNPKSTFEARTVEGMRGQMRASGAGSVARHRPENRVERTRDDLFVTTGAIKLAANAPRPEAPTTSRQYVRSYVGAARGGHGAAVSRPQTDRVPAPRVVASRREGDGFIDATRAGKGSGTDHGRSAIRIGTTNRVTTETNAHRGGVTSMIKAVMSQFVGTAKPVKRQETEVNRHRGMPSAQVPARRHVSHADDVPRTTVKETLVNEAPLLNVSRTRSVGVAYDPAAVARRTVRETTSTSAPTMNLATRRRPGAARDPAVVARRTVRETTEDAPTAANVAANRRPGTCRDPQVRARNTVRETTLSETPAQNVAGRVRGPVADPRDVPGATIRDTTQDVAHGQGWIAPRWTGSVVYDPDDVPRCTVRETASNVPGFSVGHVVTGSRYDQPAAPETAMDAPTTARETLPHQDTRTNVRVSSARGAARSAEDGARATHRETTEEASRNGNVDGAERCGPGAYATSTVQAKATQKQSTSKLAYAGGAERARADGYKVATVEAKMTHKETLRGEYTGQQASVLTMPTAAPAIAIPGDGQERLLEVPEAMGGGVKVAADGIGEAVTRRSDAAAAENKDWVWTREDVKVYQTIDGGSLTRVPQESGTAVMDVDPTVLAPLASNPYVISVHQAACSSGSESLRLVHS